MLRKLWLFFVVFLFLPAPRAAASSAEPAVSSAAELAAWARQHQQAGGSVRLANNLVWDQRGTKLAPLEGGLFSIDLAGHTITVPQNTMLNTARTSFSTSGPQPAFSVEGGLLLLEQQVQITAVGQNAVAVSTSLPNGLQSGPDCILRAQGAGAVAVNAPQGLTAVLLHAEASGAGAAALAAGGPVDLSFSALQAQGGPAIRPGGPLTLDTCSVSPQPSGAAVYTGRLHQVQINGCPLYARAGGAFSPPAGVSAVLYSGRGRRVAFALSAAWSAPFPAQPGVYRLRGLLQSPFSGALPGGGAFEYPLILAAPGDPILLQCSLASGGISLFLADPVPAGAAVQVECLQAGAWQALPPQEVEAAGRTVNLQGAFAPGASLVFCVRVAGRPSNLLQVRLGQNAILDQGPIGGDRDGGDRGEQALPIRPVPAPTPPASAAPPVLLSTALPASLPPLLSTALPVEPSPQAGGLSSPSPSPSPLPSAAVCALVPSPSPPALSAAAPPSSAPAKKTFPPLLLWLGGAAVLAALFFAAGCRWPRAAALAGGAAVGSAVFLAGYRLDNKYLAPFPAACLPSLQAENEALTFLVDGWQYYPGEFLTPAQCRVRQPARQVFIGQFSGFELGRPGADPHGAGTWRLVLPLAAARRGYALELPQIFGSHSIWVNGKLVRAGGPAPWNAWKSAAVFRAGTQLEIVVAVRDTGQLYSGFVYPPAFGAPRQVLGLLQLRLLLAALGMGVALLLGALLLAAGLRTGRHGLGAGYALLCLCWAACLSRVPVQALGLCGGGWRRLELAGFYGVLFALLLVAPKLYGLPRPLRWSAAGAGAAAWAAALALPGRWAGASAGLLFAVSRAVGLYKLAAVLLLAGGALWGARRQGRAGLALAAGFCGFAAVCLWDRLLPMYEPVLLGWPIENAGFCLILLLGGVLCADMLATARQALLAREAEQRARQLLQARAAYETRLAAQVETARRQRHELRRWLFLLRHYRQAGRPEKADALLEELCGPLAPPLAGPTGSELVDSLLALFARQAAGRGVELAVQACPLPAHLPFGDVELCCLLGNLLDNALTACAALPAPQRRVELRLQAAPGALRVLFQNPAPTPPRLLRGRPVTQKSDPQRHGLGLGLAAQAARGCGGSLRLGWKNGRFTALAVLPLTGAGQGKAPPP